MHPEITRAGRGALLLDARKLAADSGGGRRVLNGQLAVKPAAARSCHGLSARLHGDPQSAGPGKVAPIHPLPGTALGSPLVKSSFLHINTDKHTHLEIPLAKPY